MDFSLVDIDVTKSTILAYTNEETIFSYYLNITVDYKRLYLSPFRDDKNPTCSFYKSRSGVLYLHDFATNKHYNCFQVVMEKYSCSYYKALRIIAGDFGIIKHKNTLTESKPITYVKTLAPKKETKIQCEIKEYSDKELNWWKKFGITKDILDFYNVFSCNTIFLNDSILSCSTASNPTYGYFLGKDGDKELWRIYYPKKKQYRFIGNVSSKGIQGYDQLPKSGNLLVITKSMKDCMCYYSMGITAIAPNSETQFVTKTKLESLKKRFKYIVVHYDNDRAGKAAMVRIRKEYPELNFFFIPEVYKAKDISDFYSMYGKRKTMAFLQKQINKLKIYGKAN